ncbi:U3 small nucleolar RNA-associated protein 23 [Nematocida displodere]|uniref:U3 small nucleolar RNA-associated protein 23 n=1 Tax=Nematocida displodere TaxID=1805483 RepID=A0A177ECE4_9MICR|nr:U3 small nucleolar RNA-associated protein 23 [Nematocida displodere]
MRTPRLKQIRKLMKRLVKVGFRAPFNILADHHFLVAFHNSQMETKVIEHILDGPIRLWTTSCEYKKFKEQVSGFKLIGNTRLAKCTHKDFRTLECLKEAIETDNPHHYFLAISPKFRKLRSEKNVPIIFMRSGVLCVEIGEEHDEAIKEKELTPGLSEKEKAALSQMFGE